MSRTRHLHKRMNQRGICQDIVDLTLGYGTCAQDRHVLDRKNLTTMLVELKELERTVKRALDKGGVVVVEAGGKLITTYNVDSYDRPRGA